MESTANLSDMAGPDRAMEGPASSSWLGLFGRLALAVLNLVIVTVYWVIRIVAVLLANLATGRWTITMNATTLILILALSISFAAWVVYYRVLNTYAKSDPVSQRKEPEVDLFPDTHDEDIKSGLSTYFEEFLSAIKIFGYVERSVFHELTRSMQMRKLIAGETFNLEEEKGFCTVVDGLVEIFVKSGRDSRFPQHDPCLHPDREGFYSDEDESPAHQRYQLLTEVRNGAPMSSLFSLMSLFTEDVHLRQTDDDGTEPNGSGGASRYPFPRTAGLQMPPGVTVSFPGTLGLQEDTNGLDSKHKDLGQEPPTDGQGLPTIPPISLDRPSPIRTPRKPSLPKRKMSNSAHPDILARATVDTTIAIIPASAFRRLIKVYPRATAHIVHVILSRFQRVTLATAYTYLGLTGEVLQTEKEMINYTMCELPNMLRGDPLARLKEKFTDERERLGEDDEGKGVALHKTVTGIRARSNSSLRKEAVLQYMAKQRPLSVAATTTPASRERASTHAPSPGELLASTSPARNNEHRSSPTLDIPIERMVDNLKKEGESPLAQRSFNPFSTQMHTRMSIDPRESVEESNLFRASILECIFKALGLGMSGAVSREPESVEGSPKLVSYDSRRQKAIFSNNAFGFMSPFEGSREGETESTVSGGMPMHTSPNAHILANDMKDEVEIVFFRKGSVLIRQGERSLGLYYVIDGLLDVCTSADETSAGILHTASGSSSFQTGNSNSTSFPQVARHEQESGTDDSQRRKANPRYRRVALVRPGGLAGYIDTISSYRSFVDVVAQTDVYVGFLPLASLERIVDKYPIVLLTMAKRLTDLLPRLILHIDFALEWVQVDAGQVIFHEGEESEAIYIVLNGRLRLIEDRKDGGMGVREEYGQGESVGELEVLTESVRSGTLHAIRDTELVKFPRTLFNSLAQEHPNITIKISKIIASRMRNLVDNAVNVSSKGKETGSTAAANKGSSTVNLRTVAILPVTQGVPVGEFGNRLMNVLAQVGPANGATALVQKSIVNHLGKHAFNKMGKLKLSQYLAELEEKYGLVLYIADTHATSPWTQTCIAQADCILLVGLAAGSPEIGEFERFMLGMKTTARKILVLVHPERYSPSGLTRKWLNNRVWINGGHYHVQMTFREDNLPVQVPISRFHTILKERVQILQAEVKKYTSRKAHHSPFYSPDAPLKSDFHRLARRLCGKSIGLVLGGGGARGIAQIGIIRAMEDAGIPVDMVGGTSIGSFIGALYARHANFVPVYGLAKRFSGRMANKLKFAVDLTYPSTAYTTGHVFNRGIHGTFGDVQIEDFWLEFYCNTSNISKSRAEFHTSGHAWRYIRASMSLAGLLPPMCSEGDMLLDGGYIDNLTVSHMKWLGADKIFAIDVGALDDDTPQKYGDTLSGVWAFFNRWNPFSSHPNPPTLAEIQARLAYVSSVDALERAKTMPGCIYMRPPISDYATLDFDKFDEIYKVGYQYGKDFIQNLRDQGSLPMIETEAKKALRRTVASRRASI